MRDASCTVRPLMSDPGEILVSSVVAALAGEAGVRFDPRGEHELRGLDGRIELFAVT